MRSSLYLLILCLALAVCRDAAFAADRVALVVANAAYRDLPLQNPKVDAGMVTATLKTMGFEVSVVTDADLPAFDKALQSFQASARGAQVALFYFAGHGFAVGEGLKPKSYLMSTSVEVTSTSDRLLRAGGISLDEIVQGLSGQAKVTLLFIDACRTDARVRRGPGGAGRGFSRLDAIETDNVFIGMSARLGETAEDGEPGAGSPFARAFAAKMATPGLRIDDAFAEVRKAVSTETHGNQRPEAVQSDLNAPTILVAAKPDTEPPATDPVNPPIAAILREAAQVWATVKDSASEDDLKIFMERYAGTYFAQLAAERLVKLRRARIAEADAAWGLVATSADVSRLKDFVVRFPDSVHRLEAEARIAKLQSPPTQVVPASPAPVTPALVRPESAVLPSAPLGTADLPAGETVPPALPSPPPAVPVPKRPPAKPAKPSNVAVVPAAPAIVPHKIAPPPRRRTRVNLIQSESARPPAPKPAKAKSGGKCFSFNGATFCE